MKVVVLLQNAWSAMYAGETWPRESWLRALHRSRSGQRLKFLTDSVRKYGKRPEWWYDNTTPLVGETPDSVLPPDHAHIMFVLAEQQPDVVVACGKQAAEALELNGFLPRIIVPHPAARLLTNELYEGAAKILSVMLTGDRIPASWKVTFKQERGTYHTHIQPMRSE